MPAGRAPAETPAGKVMVYEYSGYLKTILYAPDPEIRDRLDYVEFTSEDIAKWNTKDLESEREWKKTPVHRTRIEEGVRLVGRFEDVRRMDTLSTDDPCFWVPLGTLGVEDARLPVDLTRYPIAEITYRCTSDNVVPSWAWLFNGGLHVNSLPVTRQWTTLARRVAHHGSPASLNAIIFRLFSTTRTTESCEIASIRFRAMSPSEAEACEKDDRRLSSREAQGRYPVLDSFLPLGVCMNAEAARRNAELLGVSLGEYWDLALEDIVTHHHNCLAMENVGRLTRAEWDELVAHAEAFGVKIVATHDIQLEDDIQELRQLIDTRIRPYADSPAIFSWGLCQEPAETEFQNLLKVKQWIEEADPNHPVNVVTRDASAFPLFAPHFSVTGTCHYTSHAPWEMGEIVRAHAAMTSGGQFWLFGPAFIYATGTPEWSTCPEMRLMVNLAFANGARGWFSYAYHNDPIWVTGSCQRTLTGPFLMFSDLWLELDRRMEGMNALAPLFLQAAPAPLSPARFTASASSDDRSQIPAGVPRTSSYRLAGPDFNLFVMVSNDVRGMSSVNVGIPRETLRDHEIYDLTDFIRVRVWEPMNLTRHLEMFPGQAQIVIVAKPEVCEHWRDVVAQRLVEDDIRQLAFNLKLARTYGLDIGHIENLIDEAGTDHPMEKLAAMDRVRDDLVNLMYNFPPICRTRSKIIEACAAICACDGVLCRLTERGKVDQAREWGLRVIPLAREITHLRLELRRGRGAESFTYCEDVSRRTLELLSEIRTLV